MKAKKPEFEWGQVKVGDIVTSQGRHGVGQPIVRGRVVAIDGQHARVDNGHVIRVRSLRNVRRVA